MKKVEVELTGITPLLMNSPKYMHETEQIKSGTTKKLKPEEEAERGAYRLESGNLYVPSTAVKGCMLNSATNKKSGKIALKPLVAGGVVVLPEEIDLGRKDFAIDSRTVVIKSTRGRILRHRPKVSEWKLKFQILFNEKFFDSEVIKMLLTEGGQRIGLLDFSPRHYGSFGMFEVSKFKEIN